MIEKEGSGVAQVMQEDQQEPELAAANWSDLALYLFGGVGIYLLASLGLGLLIPEVNLATAVLIAALNFLVLAGSVFLFGVRRGKLSWESIGLVPPRNLGRFALTGAGLAIAILPLRLAAGGLGLLVEQALTGEISSLAMREGLFSVGMDSWYGILLMVLGIGVLAPIGEELFFRGLLFDFFRKKTGLAWGVALSSLAFGLAHFDSLAVVASSLVMGIVMAIAVARTGSIWISIFMHIFTNTGAVLTMAAALQIGKILETPIL
ncbi:MAG: CPBP family intramembrane metalloprotease [Anaerolineales bacterium]|nr:CPBP family intramembrane metalloprotease [Anaerolineales bacterium]